MQRTDPVAILAFSLRKPSRIPELCRKISRRFCDTPDSLTPAEHRAWLAAHVTDLTAYALGLNPSLWEEACLFGGRLAAEAASAAAHLPLLGGGGAYPFLYFLTRHRRPGVIVETGVGAGYSSAAFLAAVEANGRGILHSSDFPYFRLHDPERHIGLLVRETLRRDWRLHLEGDEANLRLILATSGPVELFHYDSDKSHRGRSRATALLRPRMAPGSLMLFDDIQNNTHFHDLVQGLPEASFKIFEFENKYVGMLLC